MAVMLPDGPSYHGIPRDRYDPVLSQERVVVTYKDAGRSPESLFDMTCLIRMVMVAGKFVRNHGRWE